MTAAEAAAHCEAILERVGLAREHWSKRMGQYSKGMKQRVKLAQGLLHRPELLVLDEPMNGLDPMGRQEMARMLQDLAAEGVSILISSHILAELESLCKNILILNWGRILASGSQKEIRSDLKNWSEELSIQCDAPEKLARHLFAAGVLLGFDLDEPEGLLHIRVKDATAFYARWTGLAPGEPGNRLCDSQPQPLAEEHLRQGDRREGAIAMNDPLPTSNAGRVPCPGAQLRPTFLGALRGVFGYSRGRATSPGAGCRPRCLTLLSCPCSFI